MKTIAILILFASLCAFAQLGLRSPSFAAGLNKHASGPTSPTPDILWWKCNEGSGTSLAGDGSNGGNGGTTDADWTTGVGSGGALSLNGSNDDAYSTNTIAYGTNIITASLWLKDWTTTGDPIVIESVTDSNGSDNHTFFVFLSSGVLNVAIKGVGYTYRDETITVNTNTLRHLLMVFDNSTTTGDIKIYTNGVESGTTVSIDTKSASASFTTGEFNLGSRNSGSMFFGGKMDDVRLYSGDRSSDVSAIYSDPQ